MIVISAIFSAIPAQAALFGFLDDVKEAPRLSLESMDRPTLFNPDRYAIRTEKRVVTAYSSTVDQCDDSPEWTAIGSHVRHGIVAANWLPIGTMIRFPEYDPDHWYVVEDRMAVRFSDRTDIWMESREKAQKFGLRRLTIEIATPVKTQAASKLAGK